MARPGEDSKSGSPHWSELDGLRAIAFMLVFAFHLDAYPAAASPVAQLYQRLAGWGWVGVDLFFVLSAFLITYLLLKERQRHGSISFRLFFMRRALRIWPLYYGVLALGFFIFPALEFWGPRWGTGSWHAVLGSYGLPFAAFLGNFAMLDSGAVPPPPLIVMPLWSVSVEEQFYIAWCLILLGLTRTRSIVLTLGAFGLGSIAFRCWVYAHSDSFWAYYHNTLTHLDPIVAGALIGVLQAQERRPRLSHPAVPLLLWAIVVFCFPSIGLNHPSAPLLFTVVAAAASATLLTAMNHPGTRKLLSNPRLVYWGQLTYGLYMFHLLGLYLSPKLVRAFHPMASPVTLWWGQLLVGLPLTLGLAVLSWNTIEKPFNRLRHRIARV